MKKDLVNYCKVFLEQNTKRYLLNYSSFYVTSLCIAYEDGRT